MVLPHLFLINTNKIYKNLCAFSPLYNKITWKHIPEKDHMLYLENALCILYKNKFYLLGNWTLMYNKIIYLLLPPKWLTRVHKSGLVPWCDYIVDWYNISIELINEIIPMAYVIDKQCTTDTIIWWQSLTNHHKPLVW